MSDTRPQTSLQSVLLLNRSGFWGDDKPSTTRSVAVKVIRNADLTRSGALRGHADRYFSEREADVSTLLVHDIAISTSGDVGKIWEVDAKGYSASNFVRILRPNPDLISPGYLPFLMRSPLLRATLAEHTAGTTIPNLQASFYAAAVFSLPSIGKQKQIVLTLRSAFDGLDAIRASAESSRLLARTVYHHQLENVLAERGASWTDKRLSEICDIKHGFAFKGEYFAKAGSHVVLTPGNFFEEGGYRDRGAKQKYYCGQIPSGFVLSDGDLLVAMTEQAAGLLGSPIIVPESDRFLHNQRLGLVVAKPGHTWHTEFFYHLFNSQRVRRAIHESASGTKVRHTSPTKIGSVKVSFPLSIVEQREIAAGLTELRQEAERLESTYVRQLRSLEELTDSLIHHATSDQI